MQRFDQPTVTLQRRQPAAHPVAGKSGQRHFVVDVQMGAGDKRPAGGDVHRAEVVGLELAARDFAEFIQQTTQRLQIAFRFEQCLRRNDHFLAGVTEVACQSQPVGDAELLAA
ncbi:MAG: hypothetical protein AW09_001326 [Candidatus Accumulibacter phosphatis]|uniref:Uncharacterized protein n=1 Tax=Candidatus Accumulibacter phosphatis TaxID=327160 RepID=A0A080LZG2_9PROT|nr:MAG: hypothetical protein AW09_001326 [Candidatus Accumulibacter phosphatis]